MGTDWRGGLQYKPCNFGDGVGTENEMARLWEDNARLTMEQERIIKVYPTDKISSR